MRPPPPFSHPFNGLTESEKLLSLAGTSAFWYQSVILGYTRTHPQWPGGARAASPRTTFSPSASGSSFPFDFPLRGLGFGCPSAATLVTRGGRLEARSHPCRDKVRNRCPTQAAGIPSWGSRQPLIDHETSGKASGWKGRGQRWPQVVKPHSQHNPGPKTHTGVWQLFDTGDPRLRGSNANPSTLSAVDTAPGEQNSHPQPEHLEHTRNESRGWEPTSNTLLGGNSPQTTSTGKICGAGGGAGTQYATVPAEGKHGSSHSDHFTRGK